MQLYIRKMPIQKASDTNITLIKILLNAAKTLTYQEDAKIYKMKLAKNVTLTIDPAHDTPPEKRFKLTLEKSTKAIAVSSKKETTFVKSKRKIKRLNERELEETIDHMIFSKISEIEKNIFHNFMQVKDYTQLELPENFFPKDLYAFRRYVPLKALTALPEVAKLIDIDFLISNNQAYGFVPYDCALIHNNILVGTTIRSKTPHCNAAFVLIGPLMSLHTGPRWIIVEIFHNVPKYDVVTHRLYSSARVIDDALTDVKTRRETSKDCIEHYGLCFGDLNIPLQSALEAMDKSLFSGDFDIG